MFAIYVTVNAINQLFELTTLTPIEGSGRNQICRFIIKIMSFTVIICLINAASLELCTYPDLSVHTHVRHVVHFQSQFEIGCKYCIMQEDVHRTCLLFFADGTTTLSHVFSCHATCAENIDVFCFGLPWF